MHVRLQSYLIPTRRISDVDLEVRAPLSQVLMYKSTYLWSLLSG